ncbi:MAG: hypothetical protein ACREDT_01665 [Methylocella sp.]
MRPSIEGRRTYVVPNTRCLAMLQRAYVNAAGRRTPPKCNVVYVVNWFWTFNTETLAATAKTSAGDGPRAFGTFLRQAQ